MMRIFQDNLVTWHKTIMTPVMEQYNQFVISILDQLIEAIGETTIQYDYWDGGGEYSSPQHIWETINKQMLLNIRKNKSTIALEKLIAIDEAIRKSH